MKYIFILDQGHRMDTSGKNANGLYEYEFNQDIAERVKMFLDPYGEVYFTMTTEKHPYSELTSDGRTKNLQHRCNVANQIYNDAVAKYGKDNFKCVFASIHANAFTNPDVSGYEIFVYGKSGERYEIAKSIYQSAKDILGVGADIKDRGIKENTFYVLKNTIMPAVLIEHEFYTNIQAVEKLKNSEFRDRCAKHIVLGLLNYFGLEYKEPKPQPKQLYRIRKSWEDIRSQIGAYENLDAAKSIVDKNEGYNVYDENGELIYPERRSIMQLMYKRLIKRGVKGEDVKQLQIALGMLGYDCGIPDGIAGIKTDVQIKNIQRDNRLITDGLAGRSTIAKINELLSKPTSQQTSRPKKYKYGNADVIEVNPLDLYIEVVKMAGSKIKGDFINGSLFSHSKMISISTLVSNGKILAEHLPHDNVKRGTFVVYKNGDVGVEMIDFISKHPKLKDIKFAIGGFNIMPQGKTVRQQLKDEWFDYNTVGYRTWRSMIGWSKAKNKALIVITPNTDAEAGSKLMKNLGCDCAVGLDSGGSTCGRFNNEIIKNTTRVLHNIIRWN